MRLDPDLRAALVAFSGRAGDGRPLLVASDFDGVLAPLVDDPSRSRPLPAAASALDSLATLPRNRVRLALVSGRDLDALGTLSRAPSGTVLIGSHGAERGVVTHRGSDGSTSVEHTPLSLTSGQADLLATLGAGLDALADEAGGAWVERKPSAVVLHTRLAAPDDASRLSDAAYTLGTELGLEPMRGKNVIEMAVIETSKGVALSALREEFDAVAVLYMGDDVTDERAFAALRPDDVTVKVGPGDTAARFRVDSPEAAAAVLTEVAAQVK
jgi:trehalose 6-phosphate phosphatase